MSKQTLPERLREVAPVVEENFDVFTGELLTEAADEIERLRAENAAIRELMNVYNLGGWTDALGPMQRALAAEARLAESSKENK